MNEIQQTVALQNAPVDRDVSEAPIAAPAAAAKTFDIGFLNGETRSFADAPQLRAAILAGEVPRTASIGGTAIPGAKAGLTVEAWAKGNDSMRQIYRPVWSHTLQGGLYGGLIVSALKLLDTLVGIARVNPAAAFLFVMVMAFMASPKFKPQIAIAGFLVWQQSNVPFQALSMFLQMPLGAMLFGAVFGGTLGMAIGTIAGYVRASSIQTAPDAVPEGSRPVAWGLAAPLAVFAAGAAFYFYVFMPWLIKSLGKS